MRGPPEAISEAESGSIYEHMEALILFNETPELPAVKEALWQELISNSEFKALKTEREQIKMCFDVLCYGQMEGCNFTHTEIANKFQISRQAAEQLYAKATTTQKAPHRPPLFNTTQTDSLKSFITNTLKIQNYMYIEEIIEFILVKFGITIKPDSLRHILKSKLPDVGKYAIAKPIEDTRFLVNQSAIINYYNKLGQILPLIDYRYCFNIDETGEQEFTDARKMKVLVSADHPSKEAFIPIKRGPKRYTIVHCISSGGESMPLYFIIPRKTFPNDIYKFINPETVLIRSQSKGFMNEYLFDDYFQNHFLKHLEAMRRRDNYTGSALLLMDNLLAHKKAVGLSADENYVFLPNHNLHVLFLVAHSSDQTQPLDLGIFSVQKSLMQRIRKPSNLSPFASMFYVAVQSIEQASHPGAVVNAFKAAGIIRKITSNNPIRLQLGVDLTACTRLRNPLPDARSYQWPMKNIKIEGQ